MDHVKTTSH
ncbi:hypothetical protein AB3S75_012495 [Citrus x aurantiifolia]